MAGVDGMSGTFRAVATPDGRHVYAAGFDEPKIAVLPEPSSGLLVERLGDERE